MKYIKFLIFFTFLIYSINVKAQWVQASGGIPSFSVNSLASIGNLIFTGSSLVYPGVYKSTNNGTNWTPTAFSNCDKLTASGNNLYSLLNNRVYISTDFGSSWTQIHPFINYLTTIAASNNAVLVGEWQLSILRTTDNGMNWNNVNVPNVSCLGSEGNNFYASNGSSAYYSSNGGAGFTPSSLSGGVTCFAANGNNVFAGKNGSGVYHSTDLGATYSQTSLNNLNVISLAVTGNTVFAGTDTMGVYISLNNGLSWNQINQGLGSLHITTLLIANNYIFAGTPGQSVWRRQLSELIGIKNISIIVPKYYNLFQNYPNPFNPETKIRFDISSGASAAQTFLSVYDISGKEVTSLINESLKPGSYEVIWDASNYPSGVYYYRLVVGDNTNNGGFSQTKKMILLK